MSEQQEKEILSLDGKIRFIESLIIEEEGYILTHLLAIQKYYNEKRTKLCGEILVS